MVEIFLIWMEMMTKAEPKIDPDEPADDSEYDDVSDDELVTEPGTGDGPRVYILDKIRVNASTVCALAKVLNPRKLIDSRLGPLIADSFLYFCFSKKNKTLIQWIFRPALVEYGLWDQIRMDHGTEFCWVIFVQRLLGNYRGNYTTRECFRQTQSTQNYVAERGAPNGQRGGSVYNLDVDIWRAKGTASTKKRKVTHTARPQIMQMCLGVEIKARLT